MALPRSRNHSVLCRLCCRGKSQLRRSFTARSADKSGGSSSGRGSARGWKLRLFAMFGAFLPAGTRGAAKAGARRSAHLELGTIRSLHGIHLAERTESFYLPFWNSVPGPGRLLHQPGTPTSTDLTSLPLESGGDCCVPPSRISPAGLSGSVLSTHDFKGRISGESLFHRGRFL